MSPATRQKVVIAAVVAAIGLVLLLLWPWVETEAARSNLPPEKVSIAVDAGYLGSGLIYLAAAKGYFTEEGLALTLQPFNSGRDALKAALEGKADLAIVGDTPLALAMMQERPILIVATIFTTRNDHAILARRSRVIAVPADLRGKTVGVTQGTSGHYILSMLLARRGMTLADIQLAPLNPPEMRDALTGGAVDAIATWDPWLSGAETALGQDSVVFRSEAGFQFGFNVAGGADHVRAQAENVRRLLRALLLAERYIEENPTEAIATIASAMNIEPAKFDMSAKASYRFQVRLDQHLLVRMDDRARWAIQSGLTERTEIPNTLDVIYPDALIAVKPDAVTIVR